MIQDKQMQKGDIVSEDVYDKNTCLKRHGFGYGRERGPWRCPQYENLLDWTSRHGQCPYMNTENGLGYRATCTHPDRDKLVVE